MDKQDFGAFVKAVDITCKNIRKPAIVDDDVLQGWFAVLAQYRLDQVRVALNALVLDQESKYGITPALIDKHIPDKAVSINAKPETVMSIQAKAKVKKCPLGIIAALYIQPRSYTDMSSFDRNQVAAEFLELLPQVEMDVQQYGYTDHALKMMVKYEVNPTSSFRPGIAGPADEEATRAQYVRLQHDGRDAKASQDAYALAHSSVSVEDMTNAKLKIAKAMSTIQPVQVDKDQQVIDENNKQAKQLEAVNELLGESDEQRM